MIILGINGGVRLGYQDVSAALLVDGRVVAAVEEERLNRVKFSPGRISEYSIREVLSLAGIGIQEVDLVATHGSTWGEDWVTILRRYLRDNFGHCPEIKTYHHHTAHAASAYCAAGFEDAMILTTDNSGDGVSTQTAVGRNGAIEVLDRYSRPDSLGIFYTCFTQYCGFLRDSDEYKLMGLASYGDASSFDLDWMLSIGEGRYALNPDYLIGIEPGTPSPTRQEMMFNDRFVGRLGPKRFVGDPLTPHVENVAASAQHRLEMALVELVEDMHRRTGLRHLCLAGGVALNCSANRVLMALDCIDDIYVQPAAGDAGLSLGAAYLAAVEAGDSVNAMPDAYLGRAYAHDEIEAVLRNAGLPYVKSEDPAAEAAELIDRGLIVGWFQGRAEFGPRALGNRSILADPTRADMKDIVNARVKYREAFRPFSPSVLREDFDRYFDGKITSAPYMTFTYAAKPDAHRTIPSVVHVDSTARVQTVEAETNPLYHSLLSHLKAKRGHGVVLNTSLNLKGQPMAYAPLDAVAAFYASGMDALFLGDLVLSKS